MNNKRGCFYFFDKKPYVSVTEVLGVLDKPALRWWFGNQIYLAMLKDPTMNEAEAMSSPYKTSKKAASRGSTIHSIIEAHKKSDVLIKTVPKLQGYAEAYYKWIRDFKPEIVENEKTVVNKKYGYAGTLDMLIKNSDKLTVVDFKTNKKGNLYDEVDLQLSAYSHALDGVTGMIAVGLAEDGNYTQKTVEDKFDTFLKVKDIWYWKNEDKCKKIGYKNGGE